MCLDAGVRLSLKQGPAFDSDTSESEFEIDIPDKCFPQWIFPSQEDNLHAQNRDPLDLRKWANDGNAYNYDEFIDWYGSFYIHQSSPQERSLELITSCLKYAKRRWSSSASWDPCGNHFVATVRNERFLYEHRHPCE